MNTINRRYWRHPTEGEVRFGYGAIFHVTFPECYCTKGDGSVKQWLVFEGLRYYLVK